MQKVARSVLNGFKVDMTCHIQTLIKIIYSSFI